MDRVRRPLLELFPHDNPPDQRHATEHVWQGIDHSTLCITGVPLVIGRRGLWGKETRSVNKPHATECVEGKGVCFIPHLLVQ